MNQAMYTLVKLPLRELIRHDFDLQLSEEEEINREYLVAQGDSLLFDQIERLRGRRSERIREVILVTARKNPNQETALRTVLRHGFTYNGVHFSRFGKSASQGKDGITAFVCDSMFDELYRITQMDIPVDHCVIAKYEAQRCLAFSACTLIRDYMPNIVILGEYEKDDSRPAHQICGGAGTGAGGSGDGKDFGLSGQGGAGGPGGYPAVPI